jgi:arginine N-succinyltransferase
MKEQSEGPAFLIRAARVADHPRILKLARELDSINLPTDSAALKQALACSELSFRGRVRDRARAIYIFCAEQLGSAKLTGASMIIAKHGTPQSPHFYLDLDGEERYSHTLGRMFRHTYLRLRYSMDGPTELGGLIVTAAMRHRPEKIGKQLSWVRFLYLARHRARFEARVLSEMLAPMGPGYRNTFWDHYGREVTGLSFREADGLSIRDKEFIRALFPDSPLYTFLLPEEVRKSIGQVGEASRGAVRLLEQAGMKFLSEVDPFDAGPYYGAEISDLVPVKEYRELRAAIGTPDTTDARRYLVARDDAKGFRAVQAAGGIEHGRIIMARETLSALGAREGDALAIVPLP